MRVPTVGCAMRAALLTGVVLSGGTALAQQQTAETAKVEEIVVTGSRIATNALDQPSPISVTTRADIEVTNVFSVENILTKMIGPDSTNGTTNNSNNGGVGVSQIGLRNLGPSRTLVLIDGQRLVPVFGSTFSAPDLNSIPTSLIERVEVLRDGASSIYGADAIGGVINIITKRDFEGVQLDVNGGGSQHGGGNEYSVSGTVGAKVNKGNVTLSVVKENTAQIGQWQRAWSVDPHATDPNYSFGSTFRSQLDILTDANSRTVWTNKGPTLRSDQSLLSFVPCIAYSPVQNRLKLNAGCNTDHGGWNTLAGSLDRTQFAGTSHYDLTDTVTAVIQGTYTQRKSGQNLRPEPLLNTQIGSVNFTDGSPIFPGFFVPANTHWGYPGGGAVVPCAGTDGCISPNLSPYEFGPREYRQTDNTWRIRSGLEGTIADKYHWEVGYVGQHNDNTQNISNSGNFQHLMQMTGQAPCVDVPGGCTDGTPFGYAYAVPKTPVNFYSGPYMMTPAQVGYLTGTTTDKIQASQNYVYADASGPVFDLPYGTVQAAVGFEHRTDHIDQLPDTLEQSGYAPNHSLPTHGGYTTNSEYLELRIPVLKDLPLAKALNVSPSVRHDSNSQFGSATTWKVGTDYQMMDQVRFRGTYATGFRAPSLSELFNANSVSFVSVDGDPCDSRAPINGNTNMGRASLANGSACFKALTALGLSPAQIAGYQSPQNNLASDQRGFVLGGSPTLQPEKSKQWNVGVVLTPEFIPGLTTTFDYYKITVNNAIADGGIALLGSPDFVPLGCYVQQIQQFCNLIVRDKSGIFQISSQNTNFGTAHVRGFDIEATYTRKLEQLGLHAPGALTIDVKAEHEIQNDQSQPDGSVTNYVGFFNLGNESIQPKWRAMIGIDYAYDQFRFHWDSNFIQGTEDLGGVNHVYGDFLPNVWYHNFSVSYDVADLLQSRIDVLKQARIVLGINNVFDKDPPFLGVDSICKCNSLAGPYDFVGRFFFGKLTMRF